MEKGKLILIPTPLGEEGGHVLPAYANEAVFPLRYFIAERAKTARRFLKSIGFPTPLQEVEMVELNKRTTYEELIQYLDPAMEGQSIGLLSEAGCPGVADPGAEIVQLAHEKGIVVEPLVGPSSILLALMGSGMNGQQFAFHGYLPQKKPDLTRRLKQLEQQSSQHRQTQLFIETPYRNLALFEELLKVLHPKTNLCVAADLTLPTQYIQTKPVAQWKKQALPDLHKRPAIFLFLSRK